MKLKYYLLLTALTLTSSLYPMEMPETSKVTNRLNQITPISETAITEIPKYVYENCNQITRYNWDQQFLEILKVKVTHCKHDALERQYKNKQDFVKNAEGYDWVYGLSYLENEYLKQNKDFVQALSIDEVKKVNGLLSRLISDIPGQFRKRDIFWRKKDFTDAESVLFEFIDQSNLEDLQTGNNKFNLIIDDNRNISANSIRRLLNYYKDHRLTNVRNIDIKEVDIWLKEAALLDCNKKSKKQKSINCVDWVNQRTHTFPKADLIEDQVLKALEKIKDPDMRPIEKAAYIWYEIVRIHISHEANKRTGKALASIILLQNGYLPPLITSEDEKKYLNSLEGFYEDNFEKFLDFVIEMIVKTQEKYKLGQIC